MHDAVVVGGSIAGAAVAVTLARRGRRVLLLEQHHQPRRKACGEGILPRGVGELAALGLLERLAPDSVKLERLSYEAGTNHVEAPLPSEGLRIRRQVVD